MELEEYKQKVIEDNKRRKQEIIQKRYDKHPQKTEEYFSLVELIQAIATEKRYNASCEYIEMYHEMGKELHDYLQKEENKGMPISVIALDSFGTGDHYALMLGRALRFYEMYSDLQKFLDDKGKDISWRKVYSVYIINPERSGKIQETKELKRIEEEEEAEKKKKWVTCPFCDGRFIP
jgi:hypothetical protein